MNKIRMIRCFIDFAEKGNDDSTLLEHHKKIWLKYLIGMEEVEDMIYEQSYDKLSCNLEIVVVLTFNWYTIIYYYIRPTLRVTITFFYSFNKKIINS